MTNLLRGVVLRGTAARAQSLDWPIANKTGTTDDYTDAWFLGFDPDIVGVWVGHDQKKPIGPGFTGTEAALPIWIDFMKDYALARAPIDRRSTHRAISSSSLSIAAPDRRRTLQSFRYFRGFHLRHAAGPIRTVHWGVQRR